MGVIKLLIAIGIAGLALHLWQNHKANAARQAVQAEAAASPGGFVAVAMPASAQPGNVLILAPQNCPSQAAQRALALSGELTRRGIPNRIESSFSLNVSNPTDEERVLIDRAVTLLNGEIPAVFVNGKGKSNPSADDVTAEFKRSTR